jgi:restriction endonuclease Mrr
MPLRIGPLLAPSPQVEEICVTSRIVRKLSSLQETAASSRVLNLVTTWKQSGPQAQYADRPLLENRVLNRSIIVKHQLRANERVYFDDKRLSATKIIIPIDMDNLNTGGYSIFIGERNYEARLRTILGSNSRQNARDREVLTMLDALPSFDPFLLREAVIKKGLDVAPCYFELSPADLVAMRALATEEVSSLVRLSFSGNAGLVAYTDRLINKILATKPDEQLEPLRHTLKLSPEEFEEGLFCWKAFLYYKWAQNDILDNAQALIEDILNIQPMGFLKQTERQYLNHSRMVTRRGLMDALDNIEKIVLLYDRAYCDLIKKGSPLLFREFLLTAPRLFHQLGGQLAAINHMSHFWAFRFHSRYANPKISGPDLIELFLDFQQGLGISTDKGAKVW